MKYNPLKGFVWSLFEKVIICIVTSMLEILYIVTPFLYIATSLLYVVTPLFDVIRFSEVSKFLADDF